MPWSDWITDVELRIKTIPLYGANGQGQTVSSYGLGTRVDSNTGWQDTDSHTAQEQRYADMARDLLVAKLGTPVTDHSYIVNGARVEMRSGWSGPWWPYGQSSPKVTFRRMWYWPGGPWVNCKWPIDHDLTALNPSPKPDYFETLVFGQDYGIQGTNWNEPWFEYANDGPPEFEKLELKNWGPSLGSDRDSSGAERVSIVWFDPMFYRAEHYSTPEYGALYNPNHTTASCNVYLLSNADAELRKVGSMLPSEPTSSIKLHDYSTPLITGIYNANGSPPDPAASELWGHCTRYTTVYTKSNFDIENYVHYDPGYGQQALKFWCTLPLGNVQDTRNSPYDRSTTFSTSSGFGEWDPVAPVTRPCAMAFSSAISTFDPSSPNYDPVNRAYATLTVLLPPYRYWIPDTLYPEQPEIGEDPVDPRPPLRLMQRSSQQLSAASPQPNPRIDAGNTYW